MRTLNLGVVAHVDAGKTTLTERLLFAAGVIGEVGSVDHGNTQTDTLALERQRGITIKSAVVSFVVGDVTVNLIDTPGHSDFIAEVERVLSVLDCAVLVVSAVEGVQAQTRVLMRALSRLGIPTLIFVNKIDRAGADRKRVLREITERLTSASVPMGSTGRLGTPAAWFDPFAECDDAFVAGLVDTLADHDDALLAAYADDGTTVSYGRLREALARQTGRGLVHPVFLGSAATGAGADALVAGLVELCTTAPGDTDGPVQGIVFKIERGPRGERVAFVRMFSGTLHVRDRVAVSGDRKGKVTAIDLFEDGACTPSPQVTAGRIARVWGLGDVRIGEAVGDRPVATSDRHQFAPPTLETVVDSAEHADRTTLHAALTELAEQDPLIDVRLDHARHEISVSLYGEVQKQVIGATLAQEYGVLVRFRETTTICIERPVGSGAALEVIAVAPNPFLATVGLRVEAAPVGSGVSFRLGVERGAMPSAFFTAVEQTVRETLREGLRGWAVPDCLVTMTHSGYWPRQSHSHGTFDAAMSSTAGDFRHLTPLVLMTALRRAGTQVHEPMHRFELDIPSDVLGPVLAALPRLRAVPLATAPWGSGYRLAGLVPAARVHELQQALPTLTRGESELVSAFDHYAPVRGTVPTRARTDQDPLHRREYLLRVAGRV